MVVGTRFCDAVIGRPFETAHRQTAGWRRRDGIPSPDFERRTPKSLDHFAAGHGLAGLTELGVWAARQAHREHRSLARLARHCHVAAHHPRELARDSEPEPRSPEALSGGGIGLAELLEQL